MLEVKVNAAELFKHSTAGISIEVAAESTEEANGVKTSQGFRLTFFESASSKQKDVSRSNNVLRVCLTTCEHRHMCAFVLMCVRAYAKFIVFVAWVSCSRECDLVLFVHLCSLTARSIIKQLSSF